MQATVRVLALDDAIALSALLQSQTEGYVQYFHPFPFDEESIQDQLRKRTRDPWWAIVVPEGLAGFFMLRGFDAGYERPAFGVFVAERYAGRGLGKLAVNYSQQWARDNGVANIMLKVEPGNAAARGIYERLGFCPTGRCAQSGQDMMEWSAESPR